MTGPLARSVLARSRHWARGVAALGLLALCACSAHDPAALESRVEFEALARWSQAQPGIETVRARRHRVLVASPVAALDSAVITEDAQHAPMRVDQAALGRELTEALARALGTPGAPADVVLAGPDEAVAQRAWDEGFDLLLRPRVTRWDVVFVGTNGLWYPNALLLAWYFWPIGPQWWIADEVYGVDCELQLDLEAVAAERPLPGLDGRRLALRSRAEAEADETDELVAAPALALDDLDRGLDLFGTWTPGDLDPDQWEQTGAILEPYGRRGVAVRAAAAVVDGLARFDSLPAAERARTLAAAHALVVGITRYDTPCVGAAEDARALAAALSTGEQPWSPPKNTRALINAQATRAAVFAALDALGERLAPEDTLIVTFAGRGRTTGPGLAGLTLDTADGPLSLAELGAAVRELGARTRVVVIDADFRQGPRGVGPAREGPADLPALLRQAFLDGAEHGAVILGSDPSGQVQSYDGEGLLSRYVRSGLAGDADVGGDGLTWGDLSAYLERHVAHLSEVALPEPQRPLVVALDPEQPVRVR